MKEGLMNLEEKLKLIPQSPGCYQYYDSGGNVIYVGKAKNLYNRVNSYFTGKHDIKTTKLVERISDIDYIVTRSETEAFILEINLIKKHNPKYNIMLTDDKSYPYIVLTSEKNPRLLYTRDKTRGKVFGPYPDAKAAKDTVDALNRIYPLRKCRIMPKKPCLYYHLGECLAPCINDVSPDTYSDLTKKICNILSGTSKDATKILTKEMNDAAKAMNFEKAMVYRDLIRSFTVVAEKQIIDGLHEDLDAFAFFYAKPDLSVQVFHLRRGKLIARSGFLYQTESPLSFFGDFVAKFYLLAGNPLPKMIFISEGDAELLKKVLQAPVKIPKTGKNLEFIELVKTNAKEKLTELIAKRELLQKKTSDAMEDLRKLLGTGKISRIEAFDNSDIQGESAVSAMVSYIDGVKNKNGYRKYRIKAASGADDLSCMREATERRYRKDGVMPDLIIVDGGKGQVDAALSSLKKVGKKIPVAGLVKDGKHQTDALFYNNEKISLDRKSYLYKFLSSLQDEVHRFAISYFHQTHSRRQFISKLDLIPGIGEAKKKEILKIAGLPGFMQKLEALPLTLRQKDAVKNIFKNK